MTAALRAALILTLASVLLPAAAIGHSTEFILVKVTPGPGQVDVEMTADYGENPMLANQAEAQTALTSLLRLHADRVDRPLPELAPLHFSERTQFDPTTPIPLDPAGESHPHQLLCGTFSWKCPAEKVTLEVPKDAAQTIILWMPAESPAVQPRWIFLLPGETSPPIPIPRALKSPWLAACLGVGLFGFWPLLTFFRPRSTELQPQS